MRNEAVWLVQFVGAVCVVGVCFGAGLLVGWRRWGRPGPATWESLRADVEVQPAVAGRRDLFAPEVDLRDPSAVGPTRGELGAGA